MYGALDRKTKKNKNEPGPGSYPLDKGFEQVNDRPPKWSMSKLGRDKAGGMGSSKVPGPGTYDKESFKSTLPRIQFGKLLPPRPARSASAPVGKGPGAYSAKHPDPHIMGPQMLTKKTVARPAAKTLKQPGPGAYEPSWVQIEDRRPGWKLYKPPADGKGSMRFTDMAARSDAWKPPPGLYPAINEKKYTRGTKWSQLHGVGRSSLHGTF
jgi:hypothetical protein